MTKIEAVEVFRQFAWNLAGKLVAPDLGRARRRPRPKPTAEPRR